MATNLYLASGGIINFDSGDVTLTHSSNALNIGGGNVGIAGTLIVSGANNGIKLGTNGTEIWISEDGSNNITFNVTGNITFAVTGDTILNSEADIVLDAAGGNIEFKDAGATQLTLDMDGTSGAQVIQLRVDGDDLVFKQYDGTSILTLTDGGNVGIGETDPDHLLHITSTVTNKPFLSLDANGRPLTITGPDTADGDTPWIFFTNNSYLFKTDSNNALKIHDDGNIGIGTTTPSYKLDISTASSVGRLGAAIVGGWGPNSAYAVFQHQSLYSSSNTTNYAMIQDNSGRVFVNANGGQKLSFRIGNADKMTINSNGYVGVNNTNPTGARLDVRGTGASSYNGYGYLNSSGNTGSAAATIGYSILADGRIRCPEFNAISDDRCKFEEHLIENALDTVMELSPQKYRKAPSFIDENTVIESGLIAQDVYYISELRHLVQSGENPSEIPEQKPIQTDPSIDPDYSMWGDTPASLNYNGLIPYLVKAIQELKTKNDNLENINTDLLTRVTALENP